MEQQILTRATPSSVTIGSSSTQILPPDAGRQGVLLTNDSNQSIYLGIGNTAEMNKGHRINRDGGYYEITRANLFVGVLNGVCEDGGATLLITELKP